jgi:hypothetical protein
MMRTLICKVQLDFDDVSVAMFASELYTYGILEGDTYRPFNFGFAFSSGDKDPFKISIFVDGNCSIDDIETFLVALCKHTPRPEPIAVEWSEVEYDGDRMVRGGGGCLVIGGNGDLIFKADTRAMLMATLEMDRQTESASDLTADEDRPASDG